MSAHPPLADEIMIELPHLMDLYPSGPNQGQIAKYLATEPQRVRYAVLDLLENNLVITIRRGLGLHVVPADFDLYGQRPCHICRKLFRSKIEKTRTCSRTCARALAMQAPGIKARLSAASAKAKRTPEARHNQSINSRKHHDSPGSRELVSERNRKTWADPVCRARRVVSMERAWRGTGKKQTARRKKMSGRMTKLWKDPEHRAHAIAGMKSGKRHEATSRVLKLAKEKPEATTPELAEELGLMDLRIRCILRKARARGEIGIRPGDGPRLRRKAGYE